MRRVIALALVATLLAACSRDDGRTLTRPRPDQNQSIATTTTVGTTNGASVDGSGDNAVDDGDDGSDVGPATLLAPWVGGDPIPAVYTCTGGNQAPSLVWRGMQPGAVEQAIVMTDVDANNFVHWIVAGIPPEVTNLDPANVPEGAVVGQNSGGTSGYTGPCPPSGRHTYFITLYSLRAPSGVTASTPPAEALAAISRVQTQSVSVSGTAAV
jgi:Raf kinase inhibitor-like YbhB/YbcL family protein